MAVMERSAEQLAAAHPEVSSWVTASAGAGKTRVLTNRALRLLLAGTRPAAMLCLTYTKAAAAEMQLRVVERLARWATASEADVRDELVELEASAEVPDAERIRFARSLFARVLDAPGGLRIQTIHAFCESLLGRFPVESSVAAHFEVMDERTSVEKLDGARDELLAHPDDQLEDALGILAERLNEAQFRELMLALRNDRPRLEVLFRHGLPKVLARLRCVLGVAEGSSVQSIRDAACAAGACDEDGLLRVASAMARGGKKDVEHGQLIAAWLRGGPAERSAGLETYRSAFFRKTDGEPLDKLIHKEALAHASDGETILAVERARLHQVHELIRAATIAEGTSAVLTFGKALLERYTAAKDRHALLDYDDLVLKARELLQRPDVAPWVLYKLDGGIDHVLIDEAQDTSPEQWEVIAAIAAEFFAGKGAAERTRTMFAVGDPKQSIYGFRRADPTAFARWRSDFGQRVIAVDGVWRPVELNKSYRSTAPILSAVDSVFTAENARDGLQIDEHVIRHLPHRIGAGGYVELWPTEPADPKADPPSAWEPPRQQLARSAASARLAKRIAAQVESWIDTEVLAARNRTVRPGDVMVLVQRRSAFVEELIIELKRRRVPVAGTDRMIITTQLPVMDLMALARFALLPSDDLNLATVLKSPFTGLTEDELFDLAHARTGSLWSALRARAGESLSFRHAHEYLARLLARADYVPPHAFFAELLANGGRRALLQRLGHEANDPVDEFLARALDFERTHAPSLQGFVQWVEKGQAEVVRDMEAGRDEVRVMTVHGAKGLQAPIVFLPDTVRKWLVRDDPILWCEGEAGLMPLWPHRKRNDERVCAAARDAARREREREYHRLLYVAMTRAEDRLIVGGWETQRPREDDCWYSLIEAGLARMTAGPVQIDGGVRRWIAPQEVPVEPAATADVAADPGPLPAWARAPAPKEPAPETPLTPSRPSGEAPPTFSPLAEQNAAALRRGVLIHRLLQLLPEVAGPARVAAAQRFLAANAADLSAAQRAEMAEAALAVLARGDFAHLFGAQSSAEVPVVGAVAGQVLSGQIDRLVVLDHEVLIVDYKTHRPAPASAAEVPDVYLRQMAAYRSAVAAIYPGKPVRCALLWTDGPKLMPLPEEVLEGLALT